MPRSGLPCMFTQRTDSKMLKEVYKNPKISQNQQAFAGVDSKVHGDVGKKRTSGKIWTFEYKLELFIFGNKNRKCVWLKPNTRNKPHTEKQGAGSVTVSGSGPADHYKI